MSNWLVIIAAGNGSRMGLSTPKVFLSVQNKPNIEHILNNSKHFFDKIILVLNKSNETSKCLSECSQIFSKYNVDILRIDSGNGDADAIAQTVTNYPSIDNTITVCWGDTFFTDEIPFRTIVSENLTNDELLCSCVSFEDNPYAYFILDSNNNIVGHNIGYRENNTVFHVPHDQSIFKINTMNFMFAFNTFIKSDTEHVEIKTLDLITYSYKALGMVSRIVEIPSGHTYSFNTKQELNSINKIKI